MLHTSQCSAERAPTPRCRAGARALGASPAAVIPAAAGDGRASGAPRCFTSIGTPVWFSTTYLLLTVSTCTYWNHNLLQGEAEADARFCKVSAEASGVADGSRDSRAGRRASQPRGHQGDCGCRYCRMRSHASYG